LSGVRDDGALEAALIAAENLAYYEQSSLTTCAATYAYHLTQAHAFLDGNKRVAAAVAEIFLELNGAELRATDDQIVALFLAIAAGQLSRQEVEQWFAQWVVYK
jgi:death on curing protein